ncbi:hypothetical protein [Streptomyces sp. NPDC047315]|uniref:hypothetical protein n=1 Tax=Streptomyces sp. NPDC047315 TaxID=3155142 RepID=UPI0033FE3BAF
MAVSTVSTTSSTVSADDIARDFVHQIVGDAPGAPSVFTGDWHQALQDAAYEWSTGPERLAVEAAAFDRLAARSERAAASGEQHAADVSQTDGSRRRAARAAVIARRNAAEYRHIAAELRAGHVPDGVLLD